MNSPRPPFQNPDVKNQVHKNLEFLAGLSHEIRNPLNALVGVSHLLRNTACPAEQEEYTNIILQTSEDLLELVNNVLDFTKIESGKVKIALKPTDLRQVLNRSLFNYRALAASKGVELLIEIDDLLPSQVLIDSVKFSQILINLVSNAVKFTETGQIKVKLAVVAIDASEVNLTCSVEDTGIGMKAEKLATIFDAFTQASSDINLKYGGTGLGLTISRELVKLMGGKLEVESEVGKGSKFSFNLVLEQYQDSTSETAFLEEEEIPSPLKGIRVLLADDNKVNLLVACKNLEFWESEVQTAQSGLEVLEILKEQDFDIILLDQQMPHLDGIATAKEIRSLKGYSTPIIALSCSPEDTFQESLATGVLNGSITKPFHPKELLRKILGSLEMHSICFHES